MKRRLSLLPLLIVLWAPILTAGEGGVHPLYLWRASRDGIVIHLLGSIHILPESFYPLPSPVLDVIEGTEVLVLEADPRMSDASVLEGLLSSGYYLDGTTLADHTPPKLLDHVLSLFAEAGIGSDAVLTMKPWLAAITLESLLYASAEDGRESPEITLGMEWAVLEMLPEAEILELEGLGFQLNLFRGLPEKDQVLMLESAADASRNPGEIISDVIAAWKSGDLEAMEALMMEDGSGHSKSLERRIIMERNLGMAETLDAMEYEGGKDYLVVVGSGHFYGNEGLPALLEEKGFHVEQIDSEGFPIP